jgi:hypothetical protein
MHCGIKLKDGGRPIYWMRLSTPILLNDINLYTLCERTHSQPCEIKARVSEVCLDSLCGNQRRMTTLKVFIERAGIVSRGYIL